MRDEKAAHRTISSLIPPLSSLVLLSQLCLQPGARGSPAALNCWSGNAHDLRRLFDCQSAEEAQLDDLAAQRIDFGQRFQSFIKRQEIARRLAFTLGRGQRNLILVTAALESLTRPR